MKKNFLFAVLILIIASFSAGCGGPGGLKSSNSNSNSNSGNTGQGLKIAFNWPDNYQPANLDPSRQAITVFDANKAVKTIPTGTNVFQVTIYQHPLDNPDIWEGVFDYTYSRTTFEGHPDIIVKVAGLFPGPTRLLVLAADQGTQQLLGNTLASEFQFFTLKTGEERDIDAVLGEFYFIGQTSSSVTSDSETITTPAGTFVNCIKVVTDFTATNCPGTDQKNYIEGRRTTWFKQNLGLIKMVYNHNDGTITTVNLKSYVVSANGNFWPLAEGNSWTYIWDNTLYQPDSITETVTVYPANTFPSWSDRPDTYDPATDTILVSESNISGVRFCGILRLDGGTVYNLNKMTQQNQVAYQSFPLDTWTVFGFWGTNEHFLRFAPALGDNLSATNVRFGNVPNN